MFDAIEKPLRPRWQFVALAFTLHCTIAVPVSMIVGFVPEVVFSRSYLHTPLEAFAPFIAATGAVFGYVVNRLRRDRAAAFVWIPPLILFAWNTIDLARSWDYRWARMPRGDYVSNQIFGPECSSSECLNQIPTMILVCSAAYSVTAFAAFRREAFKQSESSNVTN